MKRIIVIVGLTLMLTASAHAQQKLNEHGLWLCQTVDAAGRFADAVNTTAQNGLTMTMAVLDQLAVNTRGGGDGTLGSGQSLCKYFESDRFKPILPDESLKWEPNLGWLWVSDGEHVGWVSAQQYVMYMAFHVVRKQ